MYSYQNIYYCLIVFFLLFISGCSSSQKENQEYINDAENVLTLTQYQLSQLDIVVDSVKQRDLTETIRLTGKVDVPPQNMVSISIPMGGYLVETHLLPGTHVKKGEVIALVEDKSYIDLQESYLLTKEKLALAKIELERQKELNEAKVASDRTLQIVQTEYNNLKTSLNAIKEKLRLINIEAETLSPEKISRTVKILAPIDGFVTSVNYNVGKYISPIDVLFELVNPQDIHLALQVFEKDVDKIEVGQKVVAYTNSNPDKKYGGEVILIGHDFSPERTITVHCHFDEYDRNLLPNIYMNAELFISNTSLPSLPSEAIIFYENKHFVLVQTDKKHFQLHEISVGKEVKGYIPILDAEKFFGKKIVIKGAYSLFMALKNKDE